jgi:hypothetical protein
LDLINKISIENRRQSNKEKNKTVKSKKSYSHLVMPRSGRLRNFIREYKESPRFEKLSFIPPFLILIVEGVLLVHALTIDVPNIMVVELTTILLIISVVEILLVGEEIHDHYRRTNFDRILTIRLDDFIIKSKKKNVQQLVEEFIEVYPSYHNYRDEIYHIACQIMQTHKEEAIEKTIEDALKPFFKKNKKKTVDEILEGFIKKHPKYKKYSAEAYQKICQLKERSK